MITACRHFLGCSTASLGAAAAISVACAVEPGAKPAGPAPAKILGLPREPVEIGHEPQFVFDLYIVDNHWGLRIKKESVQRVFHQPVKHPANPLVGIDDDFSWHWILRDPDTGLFRMWYQANLKRTDAERNAEIEAKSKTAKERRKVVAARYERGIAYAESRDGIQWERPKLGLVESGGDKNNNLLLLKADAPQMVEGIPEKDRRGCRYVMSYLAGGIYLIGSHDGIHWDEANRMRIAHLFSDHPNCIVFDPRLDEYVMFCRAKHLYNVGNDAGPSRRVARMGSKELWTDWLAQAEPQTIIDEIDPTDEGFNFSMAMPVRYYAGIYWGFHEPFRYNDILWTEVMTSRDGVHFQKVPGRSKLIEFGADGAWDDTMIMGSASWVEVGDEWWFYYNGWDGPHGATESGKFERTGKLGLATLRKEGLISMRAPPGGAMIVTRQVRWPGGGLLLNADAREGEVKVAVSGEKRQSISGFGFGDGEVFRGDSVSHEYKWAGRSLDGLKGRVIRLEIEFRNADLYTFRADDGRKTASPADSR
jgi:hypothetical protein